MMVDIQSRLGCFKSPWDSKRLLYMVRSPSFEEVVQIPEEWDGLKDIIPCLGNQGDVGTCVGWAAKGLMFAIVQFNDKRKIDFSAGSIYAHSREYCDPPIDPASDGSYPIAAMKTLTKDGATTEQCSPTDVIKPFSLAECPEWREIAKDYKFSTYRQVPNDPDSMKAAIYGVTYIQPYTMSDGSSGKCPLYVAIPVYWSFQDASSNGGVVAMPQSNEYLLGGHAVLIRGWKKINNQPYWIVVNSWGTEVGDKGVYYLPFGYPLYEAWMITDDQPLPEPEPEPTPPPQPEPTPSSCRIGNTITRIINLYSRIGGRRGRFFYLNP